jgi:PadR family transcriptional regulator, regulatory protein AphA
MSSLTGTIRPMSLRHAVLGLLDLSPSTGYELAQRFDRTLSHAWHATHSQIYPELARLEEEGMAEVIGEGARRSRTYAITDGGRDELRRWLLESEPKRAQRNETAMRWFLLLLLDPPERRVVLEREIAFVDEADAELHRQEALLPKQAAPRSFRPTLDLGLRMQAVMREWLTEQLEAVAED